MASIEALLGVFRNPRNGELCSAAMAFVGPLFFAVFVGVVIGWIWKPKWAKLETPKFSFALGKTLKSSFLSRSDFTPLKADSAPSQSQGRELTAIDDGFLKKSPVAVPSTEHDDCSASQQNGALSSVVTEEDLHNLWRLVEMKDGGPSWKLMMDRSTSSMSYQAWQRDPEIGPPQYWSRTVYEGATPELVRDFYWDDKFRSKWDNMLAHSETIVECPTTGTMVVRWIRKFPFFVSDREYIIGRRIWEFEGSYYCVTKGIPWPSIPKREKPIRVDLYYSSWFIRPVESRRGDGQLSACEVLFFHHEDMGIPRELAKLGVRQGMWGVVKKMEPGLRAYERERALDAPLSGPASMARINTKVKPECLRNLESEEDLPTTAGSTMPENPLAKNIPKILIISGAIALALSLDKGLLYKAIIVRMGRRLANRGKNMNQNVAI